MPCSIERESLTLSDMDVTPITNDLVAGEVRAWLARREMSGRQIAQQLGWTEIYLNRRLRGVVPFNVVDLNALAMLLEVPVTRFFENPNRGSTGIDVRRPGFCRPLAAAA